MSTTITLYQVNHYNIMLKSAKQYKFNSIDTAAEFIANNELGLHERITKNMPIKFALDLDGITIELQQIIDNLIAFFNSKFKLYNIEDRIQETDISYTNNLSKNASYHLNIPRLYGSSLNIKYLTEEFMKAHEYTKSNGFDSCSFGCSGTGHWFRLPNQLKESIEGTTHVIVSGKMEDFVLQYVPKDGISIDSFVTESTKKETKKVNNTIKFDSHQTVKDIAPIVHRAIENIVSIDNNIIPNPNNDTSSSLSEFNKTQFEQYCRDTYIIDDYTREIIEKLLLIDQKLFDNYNTWYRIGIILKNCWSKSSSPYAPHQVWADFSLFHSPNKFKIGECEAKLATFKSNDIGMGTLNFYANESDPIKFSKLAKKFKNNEIKGTVSIRPNSHNVLEFVQKDESVVPSYVKYFKSKYINESTEVMTDIDKLLTQEDFRIFGISSRCGSGKSTILEKIFTYIIKKKKDLRRDPKIIAFSARRSFTQEFKKRFQKLGMTSYMDPKTFNEDFCIVQLESLQRFISTTMHLDVDKGIVRKVPKYDIVIIDEINSILTQFNTHTMKDDKSKSIFEFFKTLCLNAQMIIPLDALFDDQTFEFLDCIVKNKRKHGSNNIRVWKNLDMNNDYTIKITTSFDYFVSIIIKEMEEGKRAAVPTASKEKGHKLEEHVRKYFKEKGITKKIKYYHGDIDDKIKLDEFKDVENSWKTLDLLIYTGVLIMGVNFDLKHFESMFTIVKENSNVAPRSSNPK